MMGVENYKYFLIREWSIVLPIFKLAGSEGGQLRYNVSGWSFSNHV